MISEFQLYEILLPGDSAILFVYQICKAAVLYLLNTILPMGEFKDLKSFVH